MSNIRNLALGVVSGAVLAASPALGAEKSAGRKAQEKGVQEIPVCTKKLGTIAVVEPDTNWWQQIGLGSPEAIIKVFVMKSGCFGLVDRGKGLANRNIKRALADSGELQSGSTLGRGAEEADEYFEVHELREPEGNQPRNT